MFKELDLLSESEINSIRQMRENVERCLEKAWDIVLKMALVKKRCDLKRVRDHCHTTGKYLGAAHSKCNIGRTDRWFKIPVVFHNLKGYDAHYIIQEATKLCKRRDAECATVDARIRDRLGRDDLSDEEMRESPKSWGSRRSPREWM